MRVPATGTWCVFSQDGQTSAEAHPVVRREKKHKKHKFTLVSLWFGAGFKKKSEFPCSPSLQRAGQQHRWCSCAPLPAQPFLQDLPLGPRSRVIKCFFCWMQKSQILIPFPLLVFIPLIPPLWSFLISNAKPHCACLLSSAKSGLGLTLNGAM